MLPSLIKRLGGSRAILFTDKGLNQAGVTEKITELFAEMSVPVQLVGVFDEIEQDARAKTVNKAIKMVKELNGDTLLALGGGSVLDTVKAVRWALQRGHNEVEKVLTFSIKEQWHEAEENTIPIIAIPTTAGTGSEVSTAALVYNEELKLKTALTSPYLCPDIALLDPELSVGLPPRITAFTGMDALTHAIEGYFSPRANPITDAYAIQAARLIADNLPTAVKQGTDVDARAKMLMASSMAILAFTLTTSVIPVHNLAHVFGAKYGVPHGLANAVLLPEVMGAMPALYLPRIQEFAAHLGIVETSQKQGKLPKRSGIVYSEFKR
ncbi:iron-containing alcohol dehydrogenase [Neobacillus niacini]|uniref:iron-containing alcohol dehydrogenase n=1 Tax=Neobacillus niacini TaxID=86668 RepID=UPI0027D7F4D0|nr:iron-containing alcohol dehydrogenase [Neobacillus niacini]